MNKRLILHFCPDAPTISLCLFTCISFSIIIFKILLIKLYHLNYSFFSVNNNSYITPQHKHATEGSTVKFKCFSKVNVTWAFNGGPLSKNNYPFYISQIEHGLEIWRVTADNEGMYTCHGEDDVYMFEAHGHLYLRPG